MIQNFSYIILEKRSYCIFLASPQAPHYQVGGFIMCRAMVELHRVLDHNAVCRRPINLEFYASKDVSSITWQY